MGVIFLFLRADPIYGKGCKGSGRIVGNPSPTLAWVGESVPENHEFQIGDE
jgi:hypothetical protein